MCKQIDQQIIELSEKLNLQFEYQDWGIINADQERFEEFVSFYYSSILTFEQKYVLEELIIASFNEKLEEGKVSFMQLSVFFKFVANIKHKVIFDYWVSLDENEFPISQLLKLGNVKNNE